MVSRVMSAGPSFGNLLIKLDSSGYKRRWTGAVRKCMFRGTRSHQVDITGGIQLSRPGELFPR